MLQLKKSVAAIILGLGCVAVAHAVDAQYIGELSLSKLNLVGIGHVGSANNHTFSNTYTFKVSDGLLGIKDPLLTSLVWTNTHVDNGASILEISALTVSLFAGYDVDTGTATAIFTRDATLQQADTGQFELFLESVIPLTESAYTLVLSGRTTGDAGGMYNFNLIAATAIPEPVEYAMLLAGLGVVGMVVRRRKMNIN
ncbi:MAG: FxDxF family PEP-CTERM protein [Betaproteobacteria bacterium]|nr:FxDxF family PEP-CTERM protein [Betaproteobacteria bacterium]